MPHDFQESRSMAAQQVVDDAVALAVLQERMRTIEKALKAQAEETAALKRDRDSAIRWGLVILGTSVVSMAGWIFKLLSAKLGF